MMKNIVCIMAVFILLFSAVSFVNSAQKKEAENKPMKMESIDVIADEIQATFMVMPNKSHKTMLTNMKMDEKVEPGSTHNIMVILKDVKTGNEFNDLQATIKVIDEDDNEQLKNASFKNMMRTYDAYFNLGHKKKYQVVIVFEAQGQKKSIGIIYQVGR